jgi:hypothetical protein
MHAIDAADGDAVCLDYVDDAVAANTQTVIFARVETLTGEGISGQRSDRRAD